MDLDFAGMIRHDKPGWNEWEGSVLHSGSSCLGEGQSTRGLGGIALRSTEACRDCTPVDG